MFARLSTPTSLLDDLKEVLLIVLCVTEIACISSQQTLPISCVRAGVRRVGKKEVEDEEEGEAHGGSESEQDTSGSPGGVRSGPRDTYKVPVRLRRGEFRSNRWWYYTLTVQTVP